MVEGLISRGPLIWQPAADKLRILIKPLRWDLKLSNFADFYQICEILGWGNCNEKHKMRRRKLIMYLCTENWYLTSACFRSFQHWSFRLTREGEQRRKAALHGLNLEFTRTLWQPGRLKCLRFLSQWILTWLTGIWKWTGPLQHFVLLSDWLLSSCVYYPMHETTKEQKTGHRNTFRQKNCPLDMTTVRASLFNCTNIRCVGNR